MTPAAGRRAAAPGRSFLPVALGLACLCLLLLPPAAAASEVKIWPLLHYRRDAAQGELLVRALGPIFHYERSSTRRSLALRPLFLDQRSEGKAETSLLYPLVVSRRDATSSRTRILGLFSIESTRDVGEDADAERRITLFPLVFFEHTAAAGASLSVVPFYADLRNFFGYQRVRMILFPAYLNLQEQWVESTWLPFPFVSWSGGRLGRGWRLWPLYGWREKGEEERLDYALWPFWIRHELHPDQADRELRQVLTPFYWRIDSATRRSRSYGLLYTHSIDESERTETWGFPWPLWLRQSTLESGRTLTLRLTPFYQDRLQGSLRSRFYLWPLYRVRRTEGGDHTWSRSDFLLAIGRYAVEERTAPRHRRMLSTLFPFWRHSEIDEESELSAPALLDSLFPRDRMIAALHAPLWRLYTSTESADGTLHWSILWDLVSSGAHGVRYPLHLDLGE